MRSKEERRALHTTPQRRVRTDGTTKNSNASKITRKGKKLYQETTIDGQKLYHELTTNADSDLTNAAAAGITNLTIVGGSGGSSGTPVIDHDSVTNISSDQHHAEVHTLSSHSDATGITGTGNVVMDSSPVIASPDINGGTIDGVTIGGSSAGDITYANLSDGTITVTAFADEDDMSSDSATLVPTQQSVKAYVDAQVTAQDLDIVGDTGTDAIDLDSETITFAGGTGITSVVTTGTVTHNIDSTVATLTGSQTLTNKSLTAPTLTGTAIVASLDISGDIDVDGTTNLDVVDIDGAVNMATTALVTGVLTTTAATVHTNGITMPDNAKAIFGAGSDLQIYHDGTNSIINEVGSGNLLVQGATIKLQTANGTKDYLVATPSAEVKLYHNNSEKLATTSTGIDVTGTVTATGTSVFASLDISGDIDVDGTANLDIVDIDGAVDMASTLGVTGVATLASLVATTADINGGTIDGTTIGAASTSTIAGTTIDASGLASLDGGIDVDGAFTVANTSGNIATSGTLDVDGATTLDQVTIDTTDGVFQVTGANDVDIDSNMDIDANVHITGAADIVGDLDIDNLNINGNTISSTDTNGNVVIAPHGTGDVQLDADTVRVGDSNADATITTNGTGDLTLSTNAGTNSGVITIADAANGNISITPNGSGTVVMDKVDIGGGAIDGTVVGANSHTTGKFTTCDATTDFTIGGTVITDNTITDDGTLAINPTDGLTVSLGSDAGDDFNVGSGILVVEGDNSRVGINSTNPDAALHVVSNEALYHASKIFNSSSTGSGVVVQTSLNQSAADTILSLLSYNGTVGQVTARFKVACNGDVYIDSTTNGGVLFGGGTNAISDSGVLSNGELLIGDGTGAPQNANLTPLDGIIVSNGTGSISVGADVHRGDATKLALDTAGIGIEPSLIPTWTGVHTHQALVKDKAKLQVSAGLTTVDVDLTEFPLQIAPNTNGEIFASYKGNQLEGFGLIGGSNESATYDTDYGVWS